MVGFIGVLVGEGFRVVGGGVVVVVVVFVCVCVCVCACVCV